MIVRMILLLLCWSVICLPIGCWLQAPSSSWQAKVSFMSFIAADDDPYYQNFDALVDKVKEDDRAWLQDVLGASLDKTLQSLRQERNLVTGAPVKSTDSTVVDNSTLPPEPQQEEITTSLPFSVFSEGLPLIVTMQTVEDSEPLSIDIPSQVMQSESNLKTATSRIPLSTTTSTTKSALALHMTRPLSESDADVGTENFVPPVEISPLPTERQAHEASSTQHPNVKPSSDRLQGSSSAESTDVELNMKLYQLGYRKEDVTAMKASVKKIVVENGVERPSGKLPSKWLINLQETRRVSPSQQEFDTSTRETSRAVWSADDEEEDSRKTRVSSASDRRKPKRMIIDEDEDEAEEEDEDDQEGEEVSDGNDENFTVWPSRDEFKDLLIAESKFRVSTIGGWIAPLVREENKWRYKLYSKFLKFVNEGFTEDFDVIEDQSEDVRSTRSSSSRSNNQQYERPMPSSRPQKSSRGVVEVKLSNRAREYDEMTERISRDSQRLLREEEEEQEEVQEQESMKVIVDKESWFGDVDEEVEEENAEEDDDDQDLWNKRLLVYETNDRVMLDRVKNAKSIPRTPPTQNKSNKVSPSRSVLTPSNTKKTFSEAWTESAQRKRVDSYPPRVQVQKEKISRQIYEETDEM